MNTRHCIRLAFFICLVLGSIQSQAQRRGGHHGAKSILHRSKPVANKQYLQPIDTSKYSFEVFYANFNNWTGDNYGINPSLQGLFTWDNNDNTSIGLFVCVNRYGSNNTGIYSDGIDVFLTRALSDKFTIITDAYLFLNNRDSLDNYFGYTNNTYLLYTGRLRYDVSDKWVVIGGYSIMNDYQERLQSISLEVDYNFNKNLVVVLTYASSNNVLSINEGMLNPGLGLSYTYKNWDLGLTLVPWVNAHSPNYYGIPNYSPFLFSISTDVFKQYRNHH